MNISADQTLYAVIEENYDYSDIRGIFSDKESAERLAKELEAPQLEKQLASQYKDPYGGVIGYGFVRNSFYVAEAKFVG